MCRNRRYQKVAIEYCKADAEQSFAIYQGEDLRHVVRVYSQRGRSLAMLYNVNRYGECECAEHRAFDSRVNGGVSPLFIKKLFGFNDWGLRHLFYVAAC